MRLGLGDMRTSVIVVAFRLSQQACGVSEARVSPAAAVRACSGLDSEPCVGKKRLCPYLLRLRGDTEGQVVSLQ